MSYVDIIFITFITIVIIVALSKHCTQSISNNSMVRSFELGIQRIVDKYYWHILVFVAAVGVFIRSWKFGTIPYGFNQDEAMAALEAFSISTRGTDHYGMSFPVYFTAWGTSQMNVLLSYIMSLLFKVLEPSISVARLPMLFFSLVSMYVVFRFSYKLFGKKPALAIFFVLAINPWQIMISRWALEANLFPHLLLYASYMLYLGFEKKVYTYLSMLIFGISMYSYGIAYYLVPIFLITMCIYMLRISAINWSDVIICVVLYGLLSWPIFAMMIINFFKLDTLKLSLITIPYFEQGERMNDILFFSDNVPRQLGINLLCAVCIAIFQVDDALWNSIPGIGPLYYVSLPLFILGFFLLIDRIKGKKDDISNGAVILIGMFTTAFASGLITNHVNANRINAIFFPMIFMIGYAIYHICKSMKLAIIPITLVMAILFCNFTHSYFVGDYSTQLGYEFYRGFNEAVSYVEELEYEKLYVTSKTQGEGASFTSEIMTDFLLQIDTSYINEKTLPEGEEIKYKEKYYFHIREEDVESDNPNIMYIAHVSELSYFDQEIFNIYEYENFCTVIHKAHPSQK